MAKKSKRYRANAEKIDAQKRYGLEEGIALVKACAAGSKFDESVEIAIRLGVDAKKSDQMVRGVAKLPHGTGKKIRILVFAKGDKEAAAREAGADFVGAEDMVQKIQEGWLDFDKAIATPDMMPKVASIAKILGPRGMMPSPKVGTVTPDVARVVKEEKAGRVEFRVEKAGIVHALIGKASFAEAQLLANLQAVMEQVIKAKPVASKGNYIQAISMSSTMGPGVRIDPQSASAGTKE
jgi:large subunit ribosomal protein L1